MSFAAVSSPEFGELISKIRYSSDNGAIFQGKFVNLDSIRGKCLSLLQKKPVEADDQDLTSITIEALKEFEAISKESPRLLFEQPIFPAQSPPMGNTPRSRLPTADEMRTLPVNPLSTESPRFLLQGESSGLDSRSSGRAVPQLPVSFFSSFWEATFALFVNVASPYVTHDVCFNNVLELMNMLRKRDPSLSPAIFVALDVVVQRAMYELSDKVTRKESAVDSDYSVLLSSHANMEGMRHIENCVNIMHNLTIPLCHAEQAAAGLGYLLEANAQHSIGCKMSTLNRQLQELLSWTTLQGQSKLPINFPEGAGPQPVETVIDQALAMTIDENMVSLHEDVAMLIVMKFSKIIPQHMGVQTTIQKCGAASFPTFFSEEMFTLDFAVNTNERAGILKTDDPELAALHALSEKVVHFEVAIDAAIKHLKACMKDFLSTSMDILRQIYQNFPELSVRWEKDVEMMQSIGHQLMEQFAGMKTMRHNQYPLLMATVNKYEQMQDYLERDEKDRIAQLRKVAKSLERACRDAGFLEVKNENSRARFVNLKMLSFDSSSYQSVPCIVILDSQLPVIATKFLAEYMSLDGSGKLRLYFDAIKKFIKSHGICDTSKGFLSSFAWMVLGLHVLLREQLIPNIHGAFVASYSNTTGVVSPAVPPMDQLRRTTTERLANVSIIQLLDRFFRYYVEEFDLFAAVVSLRNQGDAFPKTMWKKGAVLWRLSIEDPFELAMNRCACDLGSTLSRPGQLTTFKALRRAVYGISSIIASDADSNRANIRKFFSKTELIHLARKSDYSGAIINPPKEFSMASLTYADLNGAAAVTGDKTAFQVSHLTSPPNNEALGNILSQANELFSKLPPLSTPQMSPRMDSNLPTQRSSAPQTQRSGNSMFSQEASPLGGPYGNMRGPGMGGPPSARTGYDSYSYGNQSARSSARDYPGSQPSPRQPYGSGMKSTPTHGYHPHQQHHQQQQQHQQMYGGSNGMGHNQHGQHGRKPQVPSLNFNSLSLLQPSSSATGGDFAASAGGSHFYGSLTPPNTATLPSNRSSDALAAQYHAAQSNISPYATARSLFDPSGPAGLTSHGSGMGGDWSDVTRRMEQLQMSNSANGPYGAAPNSGRRQSQQQHQQQLPTPPQLSARQSGNASSYHRSNNPPAVPTLNFSAFGSSGLHPQASQPANSQGLPSYWNDPSPRTGGSGSFYNGSSSGFNAPSTSSTGMHSGGANGLSGYNNLLQLSSPLDAAVGSSTAPQQQPQQQPSWILSVGAMSGAMPPAPNSHRSDSTPSASANNNSNLDASLHSNSTDYAHEISSLVMNHPIGIAGNAAVGPTSTTSGSESNSAPSSARSYHLYQQQQQQQQQQLQQLQQQQQQPSAQPSQPPSVASSSSFYH